MQLVNRETGEQQEVTFRPFEHRDAAAIVDCLKDAYGNTYVKQELYQTESICQQSDSGTVLFTVCETAQGEVAGMVGARVLSDFPGQYELASQVVKTRYHGFGISTAHLRYLIGLLETKDCLALYAHSLCCHTISQKNLENLGFTACGFVLSLYDSSRFRHQFHAVQGAKESQIIHLRRSGLAQPGTLFVREAYLPFVGQVYTELQVPMEFCTEEYLPTEADSVLRVANDSFHQTCTVWLEHCGKQLPQQLNALLERLAENPLQTVNLYLNARDRGAVYGSRILQETGFFFTGMQPLCSQRDYLLFHHPMAVEPNFEDIQLLEKYKEQLEFVKACRGAL
ncbi:MAG: GNAT family N-acetyltransferase [Angelakisella sp.]